MTGPSILQAIAAHRQAIQVDEASYDDDGSPLSKDLAARTGAAESSAFQALAVEPCRSHADIQAKVHYLLTGSVGVRTPLIECFGFDEYGGDAMIYQFVASLLLPDPE
ncbi:hypothetical protein LJR030_005378 [Rhizobium sp. LjRoot30]|uniref:hypothetical protein n=1 Tax=Rhizobium sp. LjRoot30 TaxID=3342320 RepID=UPI003ECD328B